MNHRSLNCRFKLRLAQVPGLEQYSREKGRRACPLATDSVVAFVEGGGVVVVCSGKCGVDVLFDLIVGLGLFASVVWVEICLDWIGPDLLCEKGMFR